MWLLIFQSHHILNCYVYVWYIEGEESDDYGIDSDSDINMNDKSIFNVNLPIEFVVLKDWVTDTNDTLCFSKIYISLKKSDSDLDNLSTLYTTTHSI